MFNDRLRLLDHCVVRPAAPERPPTAERLIDHSANKVSGPSVSKAKRSSSETVQQRSGLISRFHETLPTHHRYGIVHLRVHDAHGGLPLPTIGRDPSLSPYRVW